MIAPHDPNAWLVKSLVEQQAGNGEEAYSAFKRAMEQSGSWVERRRAGGALLLDSFLQYACSADLEDARTIAWIESYLGSPHRSPRSRLLGAWLTTWLEENDAEESR